MKKTQFTPGFKGTYEEGYDHPIKAIRKDTEEVVAVRIMGRDEMPDDGRTYYVDTNCSIYEPFELDIQNA